MPARLLFRVGQHVRFADLQRHVLAIGVFLRIYRQREALRQIGPDDDGAVRLRKTARALPSVSASRRPASRY